MSLPDHSALDALLEQARAAEPPALTALESRRHARLAVAAAEQTRARARRLAWLCAACLALGSLILVVSALTTNGTTIEVAAGERPLRVALTSGDTVLAAPGARLELISQDVAHRELRLTAGVALFDVTPLRGAQRFEVHTPTARVSVRGTVFSVEVTRGRTIVRVYEGRVFVSEHSLSAGAVWVSSGADALEADPLGTEGHAAATLRRAEPALIVSALPEVTPTAPPGDEDAAGVARPAVINLPTVASARTLAEPSAGAAVRVTLDEARSWLLAGDSERALAAAQQAFSEPAMAEQPAWSLLEADALHALGRYAEAVDRYQRLAEAAPALRISAGYSGASLAFYQLHDARRALALLDGLALDESGSPLRERASVLRVDAWLALGQHERAKLAARRYLEQEPETQVSRRMRALAR